MHPLDWAIFLLVYLGLALGTLPLTRLDRAALALIGGVAVIATGRLTFHQAINTIDFPTLALLFAMMVLSAQLRLGGFYARVGQLIIRHAHSPWILLIGVVVSSALLSALFANDIICLAFTPVLCMGLQAARRDPLPYLIALATSSNIGSAATLIGNPQNMLIGQLGHLSFARYAAVAGPLVLVCLGLNVLAVAWVYRRRLFAPTGAAEMSAQKATPSAHADGKAEAPAAAIPEFDRWRVIKTLLITAALVVVFVWAPIPREVAALVAASLVMISRKTDPRRLMALVDWNLILLFIGLFVVIGNVQQHGMLDAALAHVRASGIALEAPGPLAAVTVLLSNLVSNVPAVLLLLPGLPAPTHGAIATVGPWYLLAVVSTLAGNLTLLGSIANLIVAEQSRTYGLRISFVEYLKAGLPLTVVNTVLAVTYFKLVILR